MEVSRGGLELGLGLRLNSIAHACANLRAGHRGRHGLFLQQLLCTRQMQVGDNISGLLGKAICGLSSRSDLLANKESSCGSSLSTESFRRGECVVWGWDCGRQKFLLSESLPEHKVRDKPSLVDAQVAALDKQVGGRGRGPTSLSGLIDDFDPREPSGAMTAQTVCSLCEGGQVSEAVEALGVLVETDCRISQSLFYAVLKKCISKKDLVLGRRVHALIVKKGHDSDTFLCNHVLRMYAAHARLQDAMDVFTTVPSPDAFTWSAIISAHVQHGESRRAIELYHQMGRSNVKPDGHVFVAALQACARVGDLATGQQVHADVLASDVEPSLFLSSCLVDMYAKCGSLEDAQGVFDELGHKDVVTWTSLITGYSQQGMGQKALHLYSSMQVEGVVAPDAVTFVSLLQACASVGNAGLETGKELHARLGEQGLQADLVVGCSLVNMYAKCGSLKDAQRVFDKLSQKNVVTWNAMIAGYSQQGMGQEALHLYGAMQQEGMTAPDSATFVSLLQACASVGNPALEKGKQLHGQIREQGLQADVVLSNSLVNMYAKCGGLEDAHRVFEGLEQKNVVTWTTLIGGYTQQGMGQEALHLYSLMQAAEGIAIADSVTFVCLLQACADVSALHQGRELHLEIQEQGLQSDVFVAISLVNMYAKAGSMSDAQQVFDALPVRDIVAWNSLIAGYTRQGDYKLVFDLIHRMKETGIPLNGITFLSILTVCSHSGLVDEGQEHFDAMSRLHGITPTLEHYTCMVDLLGRAGQLEEALTVVSTMPMPPDAAVWHTLLGACAKWSNVEMGRRAFEETVKLNGSDAAAYVLMSNIYAGAQMWEEAEKVQAWRKGIGARKPPGQSWWTDLGGLVHTFVVGDVKHPESAGIYARLQQLGPRLKEEGYVPHLDMSSGDMSMLTNL